MKLVKLGNLASIQTGKIDVNKAVVGGKYPFFTCSRDVYEINDAPFEGKAVLVAGNGDLNVKYYEGKFNAYQRTYFLFVNNEEELLPRYLYWFLESYVGQLRSESIGSTIKYIKIGNLTDAEIPLPSLEKQREIVKKLDIAFAEIDLLERNLKLYDEKTNQWLQSQLNYTFTDAVIKSEPKKSETDASFMPKFVRIGDVCQLMTGGTPSRTRPEYFENGTIKWLVSGDINQVEIFDCNGRITLEAMKSSNTKILPINSVMIALNGQGKTRGTVALLRTKATCNQSLVSISPKDEKELLPEFLFHNLRMRYQEIRRMTGDDGNDRRGLNMILIREIEIPLPSLEKQRQIVDKLDVVVSEIDKIKNQIAIKKDFVGMLRQSLLSDAFSSKEAMVTK